MPLYYTLYSPYILLLPKVIKSTRAQLTSHPAPLFPFYRLQGVFIFFFHVVRHEKVWPVLTAKCRGKKKYTVSTSASTKTVRAAVYIHQVITESSHLSPGRLLCILSCMSRYYFVCHCSLRHFTTCRHHLHVTLLHITAVGVIHTHNWGGLHYLGIILLCLCDTLSTFRHQPLKASEPVLQVSVQLLHGLVMCAERNAVVVL